MAGTLLVTGSTHQYKLALPPGNSSFTPCLSSPSCFSSLYVAFEGSATLLCTFRGGLRCSESFSLSAKTDEFPGLSYEANLR